MDAPPHTPALGAAGERCTQCGSALASDQRYCLACGARRGPPRLDPLLHARGVAQAPGGGSPELVPDVPVWAALPPAALALGRPRVAATCAAAVLAAGALLGAAVLPGPQSARAGRLVIARSTAPATPVAEPEAPAASAEPEAAPDALAGEAATDDSSGVPVLAAGAPPPTPVAPAATPKEEDPAPDATTPAATSPVPVKHVWVISLEGMNVATAGGLADLRASGTTLTGYTSVARGSLANAIALISGQPPTAAQTAGCATYSAVTPGTVAARTGLVSGDGCVEPPLAATLTDRLTGAGTVWRAYAEDIGAGAPDQTSCRHPELGAADPAAAPRPGDAYLTWRNPFVYFRSITESADCGTAVVGMDRLAADLRTAAETPAFSYLIPSACHDGSAAPCAPGAPAGEPAAATWLGPTVAAIQASPAYADGGLIVVTAPDGPRPAGATDGGVPVGAVLLSPYVAAGATVPTPYDHLGLLKTLALIFGVDPPGRAADARVQPLGADAFANAPAPGGD